MESLAPFYLQPSSLQLGERFASGPRGSAVLAVTQSDRRVREVKESFVDYRLLAWGPEGEE